MEVPTYTTYTLPITLQRLRREALPAGRHTGRHALTTSVCLCLQQNCRGTQARKHDNISHMPWQGPKDLSRAAIHVLARSMQYMTRLSVSYLRSLGKIIDLSK